ncbi:hypothetical protein BDR07DRAFT_43248 [Suillus spraguei]|nr:hypothetical protein BDR07DRAFT_43248 [Suillus spraguei]
MWEGLVTVDDIPQGERAIRAYASKELEQSEYCTSLRHHSLWAGPSRAGTSLDISLRSRQLRT